MIVSTSQVRFRVRKYQDPRHESPWDLLLPTSPVHRDLLMLQIVIETVPWDVSGETRPDVPRVTGETPD